MQTALSVYAGLRAAISAVRDMFPLFMCKAIVLTADNCTAQYRQRVTAWAVDQLQAYFGVPVWVHQHAPYHGKTFNDPEGGIIKRAVKAAVLRDDLQIPLLQVDGAQQLTEFCNKTLCRLKPREFTDGRWHLDRDQGRRFSFITKAEFEVLLKLKPKLGVLPGIRQMSQLHVVSRTYNDKGDVQGIFCTFRTGIPCSLACCRDFPTTECVNMHAGDWIHHTMTMTASEAGEDTLMYHAQVEADWGEGVQAWTHVPPGEDEDPAEDQEEWVECSSCTRWRVVSRAEREK